MLGTATKPCAVRATITNQGFARPPWIPSGEATRFGAVSGWRPHAAIGRGGPVFGAKPAALHHARAEGPRACGAAGARGRLGGHPEGRQGSCAVAELTLQTPELQLHGWWISKPLGCCPRLLEATSVSSIPLDSRERLELPRVLFGASSRYSGKMLIKSCHILGRQ